MIFLGVDRGAGLGGRVAFALLAAEHLRLELGEHPPWLVVLGGTLAAALVIWILIKLLKWALWLLFFAVLLGGTFWAAYLWLE